MPIPPDQSPTSAPATRLPAPERSEGREEGRLPVKSSANDWSEFAQLMLLTCLGALLMVSCVALTNRFTLHHKEANALEEAALMAARELAEITVQQSNFGYVGLCDLPADRLTKSLGSNRAAVSIDRLYEALRVDEEIALKLNHPLMQKLVRSDLAVAHQLQQELSQKLRQSVEPDSLQTKIKLPLERSSGEEQDNRIFRDVYRLLSEDRRAQQAQAIEVKITLGRAKVAILTRDCEVHLVDPSNFVALTDDSAPYLVQVEAVYEKRGVREAHQRPARACALIAAPNVEPPSSAFVLGFPSGVPPQFRSAHDILFYDHWSGSGDWQQAVGSEVPGKGSLAPPLGSVMPGMRPGDAMAVALYDWLKSAGASIDADRAVQLITSNWDPSPLSTTGHHDEEALDGLDLGPEKANSCLARDTGAREYSIMNQTAPGTTGQAGLSRAFSIFDPVNQGLRRSRFPQSALPLFIDKDGCCNMSGRQGFDQALMQDFLRSLHDTNIAAISSRATAKQVAAAASAALLQLDQKMLIERQELASVAERLSQSQLAETKLRAQSQAQTPQRIELARQRIATLKAIIRADEEQRKRYQRMNRLAIVATNTATRLANATFEVGAQAFRLCKDGIYRIDLPNKGFLIGKKYVFTPYTTPLVDTDFLNSEVASQPPGGADSQGASNSSAWFERSLEAVVAVESAFTGAQAKAKIEGVEAGKVLARAPLARTTQSGMVVLDSRSILKTMQSKPQARAYRENVFINIPIPPGQLLYYCQNAVRSGDKPKVSWSVLLRDLVASKASGSEDEPVGSPIQAQQRQWCGADQDGQCPGLSLRVANSLPAAGSGQHLS